ncbi:MAG TPA: hypothetical protein VIF09_01600 [Polyangiaceae bacterium]
MSRSTRDLAAPVHAALAKAAPRGVSRTRKRVALAIAATSDIAQWFFFPVLSEGALSPFEIALDAATAMVILLVVGFQWRLAFALAVELVPGLDMFPTWAAVVLSLPVAEPVAAPVAAQEIPSSIRRIPSSSSASLD